VRCGHLISPVLVLMCTRLKVVGSGHSWSDIALTAQSDNTHLVRLTRMNRFLSVNADKKQITVQAGLVLRNLIHEARSHGLALNNLGSVINVRVFS
jgi:L-gulonolactone oxidase